MVGINTLNKVVTSNKPVYLTFATKLPGVVEVVALGMVGLNNQYA